MKKIALLILITFTAQYIFAQSTIDKTIFYNQNDKFFADYFFSPKDNNDSLSLIIPFKISNSALAYSQSKLSRTERNFVAYPIVELVLYDSDGIIRKRELRTDTFYVDSFDKTNDPEFYTYSHFNFPIKKNKYLLKLTLLDKYSQIIQTIEFNVNANLNSNNKFSKPFFYKTNNGKNTPIISNGNIPFSSNPLNLFILNYNNNNNYNIKIEKLKNSDAEFEYWKDEISYTNNVEIYKHYYNIQVKEFQKIELIDNNSNFDNYSLSELQIPAYEFVPGKYRMTIGQIPDTNQYYFRVEWQNKPLSLRNVEFAAESMKYILTDDEYHQIRKGKEKEIFSKIIDYWKKKDPTPSSPYNEAMSEYFKRVDYAAINFKTLKIKDGSKSDKGKIYILYGKPANIKNDFNEENSIEYWEYNHPVNKIFVFKMISAGVFKLVEIQNKNSDENKTQEKQNN